MSLPWTDLERRDNPLAGNLSLICKIRIEQSHQFLEPEDGWFALKVLEKRLRITVAQNRFENEVAANLRVSHPHIAPLLSAFQHRADMALVFPWASGGNLKELWGRLDPTSDMLAWMENQCFQLADALATIHGYTSHNSGAYLRPQLHQDIKAENVLCFDTAVDHAPLYKLKITDFGQAIPFDTTSGLEFDVSQPKTYRPPEGDEDLFFCPGLTWDVWSLGCLYLDFITWAIVGRGGIEKFRNRRRQTNQQSKQLSRVTIREDVYFQKKTAMSLWGVLPWGSPRLVARVKDSVTSHIHYLRHHPRCTLFLGELLTCIETQMLVIDPSCRATSDKIRDRLGILLQGDESGFDEGV
ncbi:Serine/threonine-protein kinase [Colletotrichum orbiculare MAFF 240422]|uniref:Serine/threonine-protein kinase n=1 Tax=Colletotrichum orbiculare (strain 104-T / ATCC 96160 / CBS 514.97 / LARS 414 / MAFF 240422) TaxID=1213857 RepID=A0A484F9N7_COLOR|nr:Serine/threonine-protein kinase [Colletotrichum orbiculare MAFF 240422]